MTKTFTELLRQARSEIKEVSPAEAENLAASGSLIVDVRESDEFSRPGGQWMRTNLRAAR